MVTSRQCCSSRGAAALHHTACASVPAAAQSSSHSPHLPMSVVVHAQGPGTWLFKLARGQTRPQVVSCSVDVTFFNANEDTESDRIDFKLRIVPEGADEMRVCVDDNMCCTPHPSACAVTFFFRDDNSNTWVLKFPPHTSVYHGFVANLKVSSAAFIGYRVNT